MRRPQKRSPTNNHQPRVFAFVDSQNLNLGTQKMGWKLDWSKFLKLLQTQYGVTKAFLFIGYIPEYEPMYEQLHELGYLIVLKPTIELNAKKPLVDTQQAPEKSDEVAKEQRPTVKGNIDVELVLYAMKEMPNYDKAIIVSGDGDFYALVEYLAHKNRLLNLMTPNWQYSSLMKPYEQYIVRLDQLRRQLAYRDFRKSKKPAK